MSDQYLEIFGIFKGKKILVTGHTGFKGSWLTIWLQELGANVIGYSLPPPTNPNLFTLAKLHQSITHITGDIRDYDQFSRAIKDHQPEVIFHLAAQPIVLHSIQNPKETFDTNSGGVVNLLEAVKEVDSVKAIVVVTSDKCYDNKEWEWGYRENDSLGGTDPYSASKAMAELVVRSYRETFFKSGVAVATARAGNVIGGGDFSEYRLVPDTMKALMASRPVELRNPGSVRPWLHVLEPLYGYLRLAERLLTCGQAYAEAWNFGPLEHEAITTKRLVERAIDFWGNGEWVDTSISGQKVEMNLLKLNWDKVANRMSWRPMFTWEEAIGRTVEWFKAYDRFNRSGDVTEGWDTGYLGEQKSDLDQKLDVAEKSDDWMRGVCVEQISSYMLRTRRELYPKKHIESEKYIGSNIHSYSPPNSLSNSPPNSQPNSQPTKEKVGANSEI